MIGLWKKKVTKAFISRRPCVMHAPASPQVADIVAIDATGRLRPDGSTFEDTVEAVRGETLVMADCACMDDVHRAVAAGVDIVSTTMAGYAPGREKTEGPDLDFVREAVAVAGDTPVFCEGRVHTPAQAHEALDAGAFAVVVGTAITHPTSITGWFLAALCRRADEGSRVLSYSIA